MITAAAPLALAMGVLVLSIVLALIVGPIIDAELRRTNARQVAADTRPSPTEKPKDRAA